MGMRNGQLPDGQISASSVLNEDREKYSPSFARLESSFAWHPNRYSIKEWIMVKLITNVLCLIKNVNIKG